jgi:hypothetical protein
LLSVGLRYINDFSNKLTQICEKSFKIINKNVLNKNSNKWWTEELSVLRHQVNNSRRRYQRCQTYRRQELINCYKLLKIQYKKLIIKTKIDKWESFVNDSTRDNPWGLVYSISRDKIYQQKVCEIITKNNTLVTDSTGIASTLLNELFPNDKPEEDNDYHKQLRQFCKQTDCNECDLPFTEQEVTDIILAQNPSKAPGVDGITADIIKKLHQMDSSLLTEVYNKCLSVESFPDFWKKSIVKVIPKSGKTDYTRSDSYRPISLLPVLGKIYEKLLINRVMDFLRKKNKLNEKQFGFSPQKSTEDALHSVISFVKNSFQKKGFSLIISLDISGAFNYCWFPKILSQLKVKECPKNLFYSFKSYFERREAEIWYLNKTFKRKITVGCPQGSSCGPFLWNISFDDIFDLTSDKDVVIECFADDTVIKIFADNISELEVKANEILEKVSKFAINNKLIFNVLKTQCVLFTRKLKYDLPVIVFNNQQLILVNQFKHLGVIIDSKITWRSHSIYIREKVSKTANNLLRFAKNKFGLNDKALEVIYKGAILPIIGYAVSVWAEALNRKFVVQPLQSLQRRFAIRIIKSYRTVSTDAANVIANLMPIELWLKGRAVEYFAAKGMTNNLFNEYFANTVVNIEYIQRPICVKHLKHFGKRFKIPVQSISNINTNQMLNIFVDSRSDSSATGAAYLITRDQNIIVKKKKFKMTSIWSEFQAIIYTLNSALNYIKDTNIRSDNIVINLYNNSIVMALNDQNSTNAQLFQIYDKYYYFLDINTKLFINYKQYSEISDFERVKTLSFEAKSCHNRQEDNIITKTRLKKFIHNKNLEEWNNRWIETTTGAYTKQYFPTIKDRQKAKNEFKTNFYLTQIITNHGNFKLYLKRFHIIDNELCDNC